MRVFFLSLFISLFIGGNVYTQNEYEASPNKKKTKKETLNIEEEKEDFVGFKERPKKKKWADRFRVGGSFNFGVANKQLAISVSPLFGFQIIKNYLEIGTGIIYEHYAFFDKRLGFNVNTIGTNNYLRGHIWKGLFVQMRGIYVKSYVKHKNNSKADYKNGNIFAGAGYAAKLGDHFYLIIGLEINCIKYDSQVSNIPYAVTPFINFSYRF